jgi:hypothetical protein
MLDNNTYNLMEQITEESKSLWRIRNNYIKDAAPCKDCQDFWEKLAKDKEKHIRDLENLVAEHTQSLVGTRK